MAQQLRESNRLSRRSDSGIYFYHRRVPKAFQHLDTRGVIRISCGTENHSEALIKSRKFDAENETLWATLAMGESAETAWARYEASVALARVLGFTYRPIKQISEASVEEIVERVLAAKARRSQALAVEAILGATAKPDIRISDLWDVYHRQRSIDLTGMSPRQRAKHEAGRRRAVTYMTQVLGNMRLQDLTRADVLRYRDWWADRVRAGLVLADTANRGFSDIKGMIAAVDDAMHFDFGAVWNKISIRSRGKQKGKKRTRPPYSSEFIQKELLAPGRLDGLNLQARLVLYTMIETGLRLSEACNLKRDHIRLDGPIPHIVIQEREDREQKTAHSIRALPLVGVSLWAMRQAPNGFPLYIDRGDQLSGTINKYLAQNGLKPTSRHSIYCLRHSFQDRILAAGAPDRLQADLMGHEFRRESYGEGSSLQQKHELLQSIAFEWPVRSLTSSSALERS